MQKTTAVLFIFVALFNLLAAVVYLGGSAVTRIVTDMGISNIETRAEQAAQPLAQEQLSAIARLEHRERTEGTVLFSSGLFLLTSVAILIAGAVCLLRHKAINFIVIAGITALAAEGLGVYLLGFKWLNAFGALVGLLAIVSAYRMRNMNPV